MTPFAYAIPKSDIIRTIIDKAEFVNPIVNNSNSTALHVAAKHGFLETFEIIMEKLEVRLVKELLGLVEK